MMLKVPMVSAHFVAWSPAPTRAIASWWSRSKVSSSGGSEEESSSWKIVGWDLSFSSFWPERMSRTWLSISCGWCGFSKFCLVWIGGGCYLAVLDNGG